MTSPNPALVRDVEERRTFAIISHPDAGKTTLTEKLLLFGGAIQMAGAVKGRKAARHATSDWMEVEKQRGISVTSSVMQFRYDGHVINLLDTPGHEDFSEDTYRVLTAVDAAVMVIDAAKGVEAQTIKLLEVCRMRNTPIITFINKLDREVRDPLDLLGEIENVLKLQCVPITWPIGMGKTFRGVFSLLKYLEDENKISFKAKSVADDNNSGCIRIAYLFFRQFFFLGKSIERVAPRRVCQYDLYAWFFTSEFPYSPGAVNGFSRPVSRMLSHACETVEYCTLSHIRIAREHYNGKISAVYILSPFHGRAAFICMCEESSFLTAITAPLISYAFGSPRGLANLHDTVVPSVKPRSASLARGCPILTITPDSPGFSLSKVIIKKSFPMICYHHNMGKE